VFDDPAAGGIQSQSFPMNLISGGTAHKYIPLYAAPPTSSQSMTLTSAANRPIKDSEYLKFVVEVGVVANGSYLNFKLCVIL